MRLHVIACRAGYRAGDEPAILPRIIGGVADAAQIFADAVFRLEAADGVEGSGCAFVGHDRSRFARKMPTETPIAIASESINSHLPMRAFLCVPMRSCKLKGYRNSLAKRLQIETVARL